MHSFFNIICSFTKFINTVLVSKVVWVYLLIAQQRFVASFSVIVFLKSMLNKPKSKLKFHMKKIALLCLTFFFLLLRFRDGILFNSTWKNAFLHGILHEDVFMSQPLALLTNYNRSLFVNYINHFMVWSKLLGSGMPSSLPPFQHLVSNNHR